jgi:hypothetical protein
MAAQSASGLAADSAGSAKNQCSTSSFSHFILRIPVHGSNLSLIDLIRRGKDSEDLWDPNECRKPGDVPGAPRDRHVPFLLFDFFDAA